MEGEAGGTCEMCVKETVCEGMDWIRLPQDRVRWQATVNTVTNLQIQKGVGEGDCDQLIDYLFLEKGFTAHSWLQNSCCQLIRHAYLWDSNTNYKF